MDKGALEMSVGDFTVNAPPILITGAARSGTSMTAGNIHKCGAWGGDMAGSTRYNRKGMFENTEIRNTMVKTIMKSIG